NGNTVTLDHLYFNGQATSLAGPFRGEGGVTVAGNQFPFRVSTGRYANDGKLKVHVAINPVQHPFAIDADGTVALHDGAPQFDGVMKVQRLVGIDRDHGKKLEEPWQVSGQLKATAASALLNKAEFHYGSDDHGLKLTGVANLTFGKKSRFKAELSGRQLDLDGVLGAGDGHSSPGDAVRKLVAFAGNAFRPPIPMQFGIGVDAVTLGGGSVQNVRGDISADKSGWVLNDFEFRAPGYTQTKVSGQLAVADDGAVSFTGPAEIQSNDPNALSAWLEGRAPPKKQDLRPLSVRGDLTLGSQRIAFEHMRATFARKTITGRFAYVFASAKQPSKLVADLNAPELDLDVALGFGQALAKGSDLARPRDMAIKADIGRAIISGIEGHDVSARINVDADHWRIDRLSVADLGGASFSAGGNLELKGPSPQGSLHVDLNAPDPTPVTTVLARFFPTTAKVLQARAVEMAPAKLTAQLSLAGGTPSIAKLGIDGHLGSIKLTLDGHGHVDAKQWHIGDLRLDGKLAAGDGKVLAALLGLDRYVVVGNGPGDLTVTADGSWGKQLHVSGGLTANGLALQASGTASPFAHKPSAALRARVTRADIVPLAPLRELGGAGGGGDALPVTFAGRLALAGDTLTLNDIDATVADTRVRGTLGVSLGTPHRLQGTLDADRVDGAGLIAAAIGLPRAPAEKGAGWTWSDAPFGPGAFGDYAGQVNLKIRRVRLSPRMSLRQFSATLHAGKNEFALDDMAGALGSGSFGGSLAFKAGDSGVAVTSKLALANVESASLLPAAARPPVTGALDVSADLQGSGLSPAALIGGLHGTGKLTLKDASFAGLNPQAFDAVTRAVDDGLPVEGDKISELVRRALESGALPVKQAQGKLAVNAGLVQLDDFSASSPDASLSLTSSFDLTDGTVDARLVLSSAKEKGGPDIFMVLKGPATSPTRSIDVSALTGWLTLRSVENQAKRLKALQQAAPPLAPNQPAAADPAQPKAQSKSQSKVQPKPQPKPQPKHKRAASRADTPPCGAGAAGPDRNSSVAVAGAGKHRRAGSLSRAIALWVRGGTSRRAAAREARRRFGRGSGRARTA
ncbi:MAG: AsmA-like C-terminal region-containing protein, partial [Pseudolabrys sp.]